MDSLVEDISNSLKAELADRGITEDDKQPIDVNKLYDEFKKLSIFELDSASFPQTDLDKFCGTHITITAIKQYLENRTDIQFPLNNTLCAMISNGIECLLDCITLSIIEDEDINVNCDNERLMAPGRFIHAISKNVELQKILQPKLSKFVYPLTKQTWHQFYYFINWLYQNQATEPIEKDKFIPVINETLFGQSYDIADYNQFFDDIDVDKDGIITFDDWKTYFENIQIIDNGIIKQHIVWYCDGIERSLMYHVTHYFDVLNIEYWDNEFMELNEFVMQTDMKQEFEERFAVLKQNILKEDSHQYNHLQGNDESQNDRYILSEYGLYYEIISFLDYESIYNGTYKIGGKLHQISSRLLDQTCFEFINCRMFNQQIFSLFKSTLSEFDLRKDTMILLNAIVVHLINTMIQILNHYRTAAVQMVKKSKSVRRKDGLFQAIRSRTDTNSQFAYTLSDAMFKGVRQIKQYLNSSIQK